MKPQNLMLIAATAAGLRMESATAFQQTHSSSSSSLHTAARNPFGVVMRSSQFDSASSNDQVIQEEYAKWRRKYGKGEFDAYRYENFKANFMAVTVRNNMERTRARQNGEAAPSPIALNEFGDCSAEEYRNAMGQQPQNNSSSRRATSANSRTPTAEINQGLQPSNTVINTSRQRKGTNSDLINASAQLRAVVQQRTSMENELAEMKKLLAEKKKLLEAATKEEQECQERLALREEQKRLLTDRLNNGWEDERGMNNY